MTAEECYFQQEILFEFGLLQDHLNDLTNVISNKIKCLSGSCDILEIMKQLDVSFSTKQQQLKLLEENIADKRRQFRDLNDAFDLKKAEWAERDSTLDEREQDLMLRQNCIEEREKALRMRCEAGVMTEGQHDTVNAGMNEKEKELRATIGNNTMTQTSSSPNGKKFLSMNRLWRGKGKANPRSEPIKDCNYKNKEGKRNVKMEKYQFESSEGDKLRTDLKNVRQLLKETSIKLELKTDEVSRLQILSAANSTASNDRDHKNDDSLVEGRTNSAINNGCNSFDVIGNSVPVDSNLTNNEFREFPGHLLRLREIYPQLARGLLAKPVAARMFQNDMLTYSELETVQLSRTLTESAEQLLKLLLEKTTTVEIYNCFRKALQDTGQQHITQWLAGFDCNIDSKHVDVICRHYTFLLENLDAKNGLLTEMLSKGVIDQLEKDVVEAEDVPFCQVEKLLSLLFRKSAKQFVSFCVALIDCGQQHISKLLCDADAVGCVVSGRGSVTGLTVNGSELFIVRYPAKGCIEVFNATSFKFQRNIPVDGLGDLVLSVASCDIHTCLYVSDWRNKSIHRIELNGNDDVIKWKVHDGEPSGLSVNGHHNLLVTCGGYWEENKLIEYKSRGQLVREIRLSEELDCPRHAIQLNSSLFLASSSWNSSGALHRVCLVDANGRVLLSYGRQPGSAAELLNKPAHLAVDNSGYIYVADGGNDRIVVLDKSLKWSRDVKVEGKLRAPRALYLDKSRDLLYVGDDAGRVHSVWL